MRGRDPARPAAGAAAALAARARRPSPFGACSSGRPRGALRAAVLRDARVGSRAGARAGGGTGGGVEATICAREFEIHVDLVVEPGASSVGPTGRVAAGRAGTYLFSEDERSISEIVLGLCRSRGLTLATAESCTGASSPHA